MTPDISTPILFRADPPHGSSPTPRCDVDVSELAHAFSLKNFKIGFVFATKEPKQ